MHKNKKDTYNINEKNCNIINWTIKNLEIML